MGPPGCQGSARRCPELSPRTSAEASGVFPRRDPGRAGRGGGRAYGDRERDPEPLPGSRGNRAHANEMQISLYCPRLALSPGAAGFGGFPPGSGLRPPTLRAMLWTDRVGCERPCRALPSLRAPGSGSPDWHLRYQFRVTATAPHSPCPPERSPRRLLPSPASTPLSRLCAWTCTGCGRAVSLRLFPPLSLPPLGPGSVCPTPPGHHSRKLLAAAWRGAACSRHGWGHPEGLSLFPRAKDQSSFLGEESGCSGQLGGVGELLVCPFHFPGEYQHPGGAREGQAPLPLGRGHH